MLNYNLLKSLSNGIDLEKIDNLIEELEDDGINLNRIPKVDHTSELDKIEYVAKLLMLKANRNRYSNMGEEFILTLAGGLEILCDGKPDRYLFLFLSDKARL